MPTYEEQQRALAAQALQAWGAPMVPTVGGANPAADPLAAQDAALAAQAQQDAQMAMAGPPAPPPAPAYVDPASVSSLPPEMSAVPPLTSQQQLAANALAAWKPSRAEPSGLAGWQPPPEAAGPPVPPPAKPRVISVDEQNVTGSTPPPAQDGGGGRPRVPSVFDQQVAMAGASRDEANQARIDADISTDMQAELTQMEGEQKSETAKLMAERAAQTQADLEEAGRIASEKRSIKEAVANDVQGQYKKLSDDAAAIEIADKRSTGQKVMGAIAIALSALGDQGNLAAGLNIGLNVQTHNAERVAGMISEAVERDLAIQRANLDNKKDAANAKLTELGLAQSAIKDVDAQEMAAKAALMDKYALGLDAIKAQGLGESATTSAALAAEKIRGDAAALRAQAMEGQAVKEEDRLFAMEREREKERKAAAAARARANQPMSAKEALELEGKALDNAKKRQELESPDGGKPLSAEQKKRQSLFEGKDDAARFIAGAVANGEAAPGLIARNTPNLTAEADQMDTAIAAMKDVLLRDESGASISDGDKQSKVDAWGLERGAEARKRGLRMMLDEYNARRASVGLPPINPIVRRGAVAP
jgi:hypothetical protein